MFSGLHNLLIDCERVYNANVNVVPKRPAVEFPSTLSIVCVNGCFLIKYSVFLLSCKTLSAYYAHLQDEFKGNKDILLKLWFGTNIYCIRNIF